jgi:D-3-phosphoglycerate dehydrogenase
MAEKWRVLLPKQIHPAGPDSLADIADFGLVSDYGTDPEDLVSVIGDFDAVILRAAQLDRSVIEAADELKVISKHGVGLDNVDIEAASERGIVVCNTPGVNSRTVAEGAISLLVATRRNLIQADEAVRNGNWEARADWDRFCRHTIEDDTLGLFGFGNIACEAARMALGLGMDCVTYDPYIDDEDLLDGISRVSAKGDLFDRADVVSVHTPLTEKTNHAIGSEELREIDYIVNTARGGVIDEEALLEELEDGDLITAGLDVLEQEPPAEDNPLLDRDDVVLTPHFAGLSVESTYQMSVGAAENVRTVYDGGVPDSTVNRDAL